jgi:hypothetical protein
MCARWGTPEVDAFASRHNAQLPRFWARRPEPGAEAVDALAQPLAGRYIYANPPWPLIPALLDQLERHPSARALLVVPRWRSASWFPKLLRLVHSVEVLWPTHDTFRPGWLGGSSGIGAPRWAVMLCLVERRDGAPQRRF